MLGGGVAVLPTDTLYGLVACAHDKKASSKVLLVKGRKYKPGTMIAANIGQIRQLGVDPVLLSLLNKIWPAPLSVVVEMSEQFKYLHGGLGTLPVRIPDNPDLLKLLEKTGPLITTSANRPNEKPASTAAEAYDVFGEKVNIYVDGGDLGKNAPSTIIRLNSGKIEVLRDGAISLSEISKRLERHQMTFDEYQKQAIVTDTFGGKPQPITSPAFFSKLLGLVGESGEVAEKFKKIYRDNQSQLDADQLKDIEKELGDVLWYIQALCNYLGLSLEQVAQKNLDKVLDRKSRGKSHGSGDNR